MHPKGHKFSDPVFMFGSGRMTMLRNNSKKVPYWRIFAMLPVLILGFISIIGTTGDNGDGNGDVRFEEEE